MGTPGLQTRWHRCPRHSCHPRCHRQLPSSPAPAPRPPEEEKPVLLLCQPSGTAEGRRGCGGAGTAPSGTREGTPAPRSSAGDSGPGRLVLFWGQRMALGQRLSPALPAGTKPGRGRAAARSSREPSQGDLVTAARFAPAPPGTGLSQSREGLSRHQLLSFQSRQSCALPAPTSPGNEIKATPCLGFFQTRVSGSFLTGPPSALLGALVTQSWWEGLFLPLELSGEQLRCHCPPLVAPRKAHPRGVWPEEKQPKLEKKPLDELSPHT